MPSYNFVYFDLRGRGEIVRLVLNAAGAKYDETRVPFGDWPGEHKAKTPFGQLPYIDIDEKRFTQSIPIARYIARINNLYGANALEALAIDEVVGMNDDYFGKWAKANFAGDEDSKKKGLDNLGAVELPAHLKNLESLLAKSGTGYYVGNKISLADLASYDILDNGFRDYPDLFKSYPKVLDNRNRIRTSPALKSYLDSRKVSEL